MKLTVVALVLTLSACVAPLPHPLGRDFSRAAFSGFVLQRTTLPEVEAAIGMPIGVSTSSGPGNEHALIATPGMPVSLTVAVYLFAPYGTGLRQPGQPIKRATLVFFQGRLIGYDVLSTIPGDDNLPIAEDRLSFLHKGATTHEEAIALLGPPDGQTVTFGGPPSRSTSMMTYQWSHTEAGMVHGQLLRLQFDAAGRFLTYRMQDNSYPAGSTPIPFPMPQATPRPPIAEPVRPYPDPGHT
jgi:hypothetical protein